MTGCCGAPAWQRMDAETLRDSLLFVAGNLDLQAGGPPAALDEKNRRRTVYGFVSRRKLDPMLALFDFPNPNSTSEQRVVTNVPLQRLFMMNSSFVEEQSAGLAKRLTGDDAERVRQAWPAEQRQGGEQAAESHRIKDPHGRTSNYTSATSTYFHTG